MTVIVRTCSDLHDCIPFLLESKATSSYSVPLRVLKLNDDFLIMRQLVSTLYCEVRHIYTPVHALVSACRVEVCRLQHYDPQRSEAVGLFLNISMSKDVPCAMSSSAHEQSVLGVLVDRSHLNWSRVVGIPFTKYSVSRGSVSNAIITVSEIAVSRTHRHTVVFTSNRKYVSVQ